MADNQFSVGVVNPLQALLLGQQAYTTGQENNKKQAMEAARAEAGALYQAGDTKGALARLLTGGDLQAAGTYSGLDQQQYQRGRDTTNDVRTAQRDTVADQHWNASFGLQKRAADRADEVKPLIKEVADPNTGATTLVRVNPQGPEGPVNTGISPSAPSNPFSYGKQNEAQSKDSGYANRMFRAEGILRDPDVIAAGKSLTQRGMDSVPVAGQYMTSPQYQKYDQAGRDFINAVLRRESGAAISQSEFDNAFKQYLPRPGDSPERLAEKQKNRQDTLASIAGGGGPSYRPPFSFGPNGELVPTGAGKQGAPVLPAPSAVSQPPPPPQPGQLIDGYRYKGGNPADPNSWVQSR